MKTLAAILVETGRPLELDTLAVPPLKPGQVLVDVAYSGVCRTQLLECGGHKGADPYMRAAGWSGRRARGSAR